MIVEVFLPSLGENVTEGQILKWLVKEGDVVEKDQPLVEIATDKADSEMPTPVGGRIHKLLVKVNDMCPIGNTLALIEIGEPVVGEPSFVRLLRDDEF